MKRLLLGSILAMTAVVALPTAARAQATADSEYTRGKDALKGGDTAGALEAFKSGLALAGDDEGRRWQFILALALTYDRAGELGHAIETYQRFLDQTEEHRAILSPKWRNRRELVRGDITGLEKRVAVSHGYVTVVTEPPGAQVFVGQKRAGADGDAVSPIGFYLPAGEHLVAVEMAGYDRAEASVKLDPGKISPLRFTLTPPGAAEAMTPPAPPTPAEASTVETLKVEVVVNDAIPIGPWIVIGSASALVLSAGITAALAASARADWDDYNAGIPDVVPLEDEREAYRKGSQEHRETVEGYELATITLAAVGGAAAIGGLLWLLLDDGSEVPAVSLTPTPGGLVGHAAWRF